MFVTSIVRKNYWRTPRFAATHAKVGHEYANEPDRVAICWRTVRLHGSHCILFFFYKDSLHQNNTNTVLLFNVVLWLHTICPQLPAIAGFLSFPYENSLGADWDPYSVGKETWGTVEILFLKKTTMRTTALIPYAI